MALNRYRQSCLRRSHSGAAAPHSKRITKDFFDSLKHVPLSIRIQLMKNRNITFTTIILFAFGSLALLPKAQATPEEAPATPAAALPGFNTAEGQNALFGLTTGVGNTAVGWFSLWSNTDGSFNTGVGAGTLLFNVGDQSTGEGVNNTALGTVALLFNTTGSENTATGVQALFSNTDGVANTATGYQALASNTTGYSNTAVGQQALFSNTTGYQNAANGFGALRGNTTGHANTASGWGALTGNSEGGGNTANGYSALQFNGTGINNTAIGNNALQIANGGNLNTALGAGAGQNQTSGSGNVYIGAIVSGVAGENDTTYIRNVYSSVASARAVYVDADNKIGTLSSSRRYKQDIRPMDKASEGIYALKPVTFHYKKEIDRSQALSFGLIAEEVAEISPDLITRDEEGKPQTVRYEAVNGMLLNEFLKEHKKVQEQGASITELKKEIQALTATVKQQAAQIQKVSAQINAAKPLPHLVLNNP